MTIQQEAANLTYNPPDENVKLIIDIMCKMLMSARKTLTESKPADTSKRIG